MASEKEEQHKRIMERLEYERQTFSDGSKTILTESLALEYQNKARALNEFPNDVGELRKLKMELSERCGLTELEAYNVLLGFHVKNYIQKYQAILNGRAQAIEEERFNNKGKIKEKKKEEPVVYRIVESERDTFGWE